MLVSLPTPEVRAVALGPDGLIHGSALRIYVDLLDHRAGGRGGGRRGAGRARHRDLDAPVSGGVCAAAGHARGHGRRPGARALERVRPLLEVFGRVFHVGGRAGLGQLMKLANNFLSATAIAATAEAVALGVKGGLAPAVMLEVINASTGRNTASEDKFPRQILTGRYAAGFTAGPDQGPGLVCGRGRGAWRADAGRRDRPCPLAARGRRAAAPMPT